MPHTHTDHGVMDHGGSVAMIERDRAAKDDFFSLSAQSPIPAPERPDFRGLAYYPVDIAYRIEGVRLAPYSGSGAVEFEMPTSDGRLRPAWRVGTLDFALVGRVHVLAAYDLHGGHHAALFVPFLDTTSGLSTYAAGRYLDLTADPDGSYVLDFNLAYHPYCAYSERYSCPLTPAENRLPVPIEAGERLPLGREGG